MRDRSMLLLSLLLIACGISGWTHVPAAEAAGGSWPSTAPTLPVEAAQTGGATAVDTSQIVDPDDPEALRWHHAGHAGVEYWAIPLQEGLTAHFDLTHVEGAGTTRMCLLPWWTSDQNIDETDCLLESGPGTTAMSYTPWRDATFYVAVWDEACCDIEDWAYSLTAHNGKARTKLRLDEPTAKVHRGDKVTITGHLSVVNEQPVLLRRLKWWRTTSWFKPFRTVTTDASGDFRFTYHVPRKGKHAPTFSAKFNGSIGYQESESGRITVRLAR
ncbi:hypothetical protein [Nocardioides mangrovi]|uniref:Carboxypeptidase regulatory-like domain-containing protein n=1 Tax=Nocardioides mangrovi TaxID=2874580 RepID=A0ABS7U8F1_9ACTN|nr:hypothetical protein [Nocardioides mangrovi]MBZ5737160.1 hypothetical protein [Nocardioides mangrovi]